MSLIAWLPLTTDMKEKIENRPVSIGAGLFSPDSGANGKLGQGYNFNGSCGIMVAKVPTTKEMSYALWLKMSSETGCHIIDHRLSQEIGYQPIYYKPQKDATSDRPDDWGIQIHSSYNNVNSYINVSFTPGVWYHVIVTMRDNEGVLYVNGEKIGTMTGIQMSANDKTFLSVGCRYSAETPFPGVLQDIRVYNHILSKKEIKDLSQALALHYDFENINVSPNLFNQLEYIGDKTTKEHCTITQYGINGFTMTRNDPNYGDPYIGTPTPGNYHSIGDDPTIWIGNAKTICISWTKVYDTEKEFNKNFIVPLDSNNCALNKDNLNFGSYVMQDGARRYVVINALPEGTRSIHIRFGNEDLAYGEQITIDEICVRAGEIHTFSYPHREQLVENTTCLYPTIASENLTIYNDTKQGKYCGKFNNTIIKSSLKTNNWEEFTLAAWVNPDTVDFTSPDGPLCIIVGGLYLCLEPGGNFSTYCYGKIPHEYHISTNKLISKKWNHIAAVWSKTDVKLYLNGVLDRTINNVVKDSNYADTHHNNKHIGAENSASNRAFPGLLDDIRIYASALSDKDIYSLAYTKQFITNRGDESVVLFNECNTETSQVLSKSIHNFNYLTEILELDDGSCWIQLCHHDCENGYNLFEATDDFSKNFVYHNDKCWSAFHLIDQVQRYNNNYEFMSIENVYDTENIVIRKWRQTVSPLVATHEDVAPNIENNGYVAIENMPGVTGGLRRGADHQAYFKLAIADQPDFWYGAFGCYSINDQMPYQEIGIPTVREVDETEHITGSLYDLYMRIDPTEKRYREFRNGIIMPTTINEI